MRKIFVAGLCLLTLVAAFTVVTSLVKAQEPQPPVDAFEFRNYNASLLPNDDDVVANEVLQGRRGWRFSITNHSSTVTNPTIQINSALNPGLFPNVIGGFPFTKNTPSLGFEQTFTVNEFENTNVAVIYTAGYTATRVVSPLLVPSGGGNQTVTVTVTPIDVRYNFPQAHIGANIFGNVVSFTNPDLSNGETLDIATGGPGGAYWLLHGAKLNKTYIFSAVIHVNSAEDLLFKPPVMVEMTPHDSSFPEQSGSSINIPDSDLQGNITYSITETDRVWHKIVDNYYNVNFSQLREPFRPIRVRIDIKPGSDPNSINLKSKGLVSVAILTIGPEEASEQFGPVDATRLNSENIRMMDAADFNPNDPAKRFPNGAVPVANAVEDVDGDGDLDLVLKFEIEDLINRGLFDKDTTRAVIYGPAAPGIPPRGIRGSDTIRIASD